MLLARVLHKSDDYELRRGLFGGIEIFSKHGERTVRLSAPVCAYFQSLCDELQRRGVSLAPGSNAFEEACADFCDAAIRPANTAGWRAYFRYPASEKAEEITKSL